MPGQTGGVNQPSTASNPVVDFINALPPITRVLFVSTIATTLIGNFLIPIQSFVLWWPKVVNNLEVWRLISCFFIGKLGFNWAMSLYFLYRNSLDLERGKYAGRSADFAMIVILIMVASLVAAYIFNMAVLAEPLVMALVYLWSNDNPNASVGFMFGLSFNAMYLPWVLSAWDLFMTASVPYDKLIGIAIGHACHYVTDLYPASNNGRRLINTPEWLQRAIPQEQVPTATSHGFGVQPPRATGSNAGGITNLRWRGAGRRLGE